MNKDFSTAIIAAIFGVIVSYFVTNLFFGEIEDFSVKTADSNLGVDLVPPNEDIFNHLAVNPTVEVYVGECDEYNETTGECLDKAVNITENTETDQSNPESEIPEENEDEENKDKTSEDNEENKKDEGEENL